MKFSFWKIGIEDPVIQILQQNSLHYVIISMKIKRFN